MKSYKSLTPLFYLILLTISSVISAAPNGNPVVPPKWAFGVFYGCYYDQAGVLDAMQRLRAEYCGDLLWVDSSWLSSNYTEPPGNNHYINFTFDATQFPNPRGMIATLHANHFKTGVWEWPFVDVSITSVYQPGLVNHYFITNKIGGTGTVVNGGGWHGVTFTGQIDFTNPAAAAWFVQLNQPLRDMGLDFIKIDSDCKVPSGGVLYDGSSTDNLRRLYHKAAYQVTQPGPNMRGFYLAHRYTCTGNDQYPGMWTGDTNTDWAGLGTDMSRAAAMNSTTSAAYWGGDTGGYNHDAGGDELYIRWLEYSCFCPLTEFFSNKTTKGRFPWVFGAQAQAIFKTYTRLRYRLLPFRYSNALICYQEQPVKYPVRFVSGRTDEIIVGNGDSELLVAPVRVAGATIGTVTLPAGKQWINYWTGEVRAGGIVTTTSAPLDKVPLFVKAGSIIPMGPEMSYVDQLPADPLTLDIYPSGKSSYPLYEDDGASNDYQNGGFAKTVFAVDDTNSTGTVIDIGAAAGDYAGKLQNRTYVVRFNRKITQPLRVVRNGVVEPNYFTQAALDGVSEGVFNDVGKGVVWVKFMTATASANRVVIGNGGRSGVREGDWLGVE